jgi:hypothetical protein
MKESIWNFGCIICGIVILPFLPFIAFFLVVHHFGESLLEEFYGPYYPGGGLRLRHARIQYCSNISEQQGDDSAGPAPNEPGGDKSDC